MRNQDVAFMSSRPVFTSHLLKSAAEVKALISLHVHWGEKRDKRDIYKGIFPENTFPPTSPILEEEEYMDLMLLQ